MRPVSIRVGAAIALVMVALGGHAAATPPTQQPNPGWRSYSNSMYGYTIRYPDGFELRLTGAEGERDGATILIVREEYSAIAPSLSVLIAPRTDPEDFPTLGTDVPDLSVSTDDIRVRGLPARRAQYRWKADGALAFEEILLEGVLFRFDAAPGTHDLPEEWWAIVSTFRLSGPERE